MALACAIAAAPAQAVPLRFTFTMPGVTYIGTLESQPAPDFYSSDIFAVRNTGTRNGITRTTLLNFTTAASPLGAGFSYNGLTSTFFVTGTPVFSGTPRNPVFAPGSFSGTNYDDGSTIGTLTISAIRAPGAPAPELAGGLLAGMLGLLALAMTRLRRQDRGGTAIPA